MIKFLKSTVTYAWKLARDEITPTEIATDAFAAYRQRERKVLEKLGDDVFEKHALLLGASGSGKSSAFELFIKMWVDRMFARGDISPIIVDGSELPERIAYYLHSIRKLDHPRVILIDPAAADDGSLDHVPAMDIFAIPPSMRGRGGADYLIGTCVGICQTLMAMPLTQLMETLFSNAVELMFCLPDESPTVHLLMSILQAPERYLELARDLPPEVESFFIEDVLIKNSKYDPTRRDVTSRFRGLMARPAIRRMLFSPAPTLDLFEAVDNGSLIIVATRQLDMSDDGARLIGRFMLNLVHRITQARASKSGQNAQVRLLIDEIQDYLVGKSEPHIVKMFKQARKYGVGLVIATQELSAFDTDFWSCIATCTAIKLVGRLSDLPAAAMARNLGIEAKEVTGLGDGIFWARITGKHETPIKLSIKPGSLGRWSNIKQKRQMQADSRKAIEALRVIMADRFGNGETQRVLRVATGKKMIGRRPIAAAAAAPVCFEEDTI